MKFKNKLFERLKGEEYFLEHVCPTGYEKSRGGRSDYFARHGFDVPMSYSNYYSKLNGIASDRYMSTEVYYLYVLPALNRMNFASAYTDKNMFSVLFSGFKQPETVIKNMNGIFYNEEGTAINICRAVELCILENCDCIIKPAVDSSEGKGVALMNRHDRNSIIETFERYGVNFIVQRKLLQCDAMALFNPTSFNTMRIYTYRSLSGELYLDKAFIRFGGVGAIKDNVSAGGGLVSLDSNGCASDNIFRFKDMSKGSLAADKGIKNFIVPGFREVKDFVFKLHQRMPYFDYIGWDIGLCEDGEPVFVEFNVVPFLEGPQMASGPMFGELLDEVMYRLKDIRREERKYWVNIIKPGFENFTLMSAAQI